MTGLAFRAWMRATRGRLGLTQAQLADRCSISPGRISDIERGAKNPTTGEALEIRSALDRASIERTADGQ